MSLDDLARLIAPSKPAQALKILQCFYKQSEGITKAAMLQASGMKSKTLDYYITQFRKWRLLRSQRRKDHPCLYYLDPSAFHAILDTRFYDAAKNLVKEGGGVCA